MLELLFEDDEGEAGYLLGSAIGQRSSGGGGGAVVLQSITVTPANPTWRPTAGTDRQQFTATGNYSDGSTADLTATATWASVTPATATINATGEATPVSAGTTAAAATTDITATSGAIVGSTTLTVDTPRDAASVAWIGGAGMRMPVNAYQYSLGGWTVDGIYLCQEASGNLADAGPGALTLTANATVAGNYQQASANMTQLGIALAEVANQRWTAAAAAGPSPATVDTFWAWIGEIPNLPAAARTVVVNGSNNNILQLSTPAGALRKNNPGQSADDTTTRPDLDDRPHFLGLLHDVTNSRSGLFTDAAKTLTTFSAVTDNLKGLGSGTPPVSTWFRGLRFRDAPARMSDATIKALIAWHGYAPPWT